MERIVECVPNFSEGRRPEVVARLVEAVESVEGTLVLDTHVDPDHNRSVITFVGGVESIVEAAVRMAARAAELIDLRKHAGVHPRVGALDVLPFVPVRGVTLEECIRLAHEAGARIAREVGVPVYFYESAARRPDRVNLEDVRRGGFELLREEIETNPERAPDEGAPRIHETAGACVVGARSLLVAYNVNLDTTDVTVARRVARAVRGRDGGLRYLKALGFELHERGLTQVSMNLVRFEKTELHHAFEAVRREAARYGVRVVGSEIVGLIPQAALDRAADYFLQIENFSPDLILENRIASALAKRRAADVQGVYAAGTNATQSIDATYTDATRGDDNTAGWSADVEAGAIVRRGVVPERASVGGSDGRASVSGSVGVSDGRTHVIVDASTQSAPEEITGGGAAAAHAASLAAALGEMVAHLVERKGKQEDSEREARDALQALGDLRARLNDAADEDGASFAGVLGARRMPGRTDEERRARANAVEEALKGAAAVPLEVASLAVQVGELLETLAELGEPAWLSDSATGAQLALAATVAARYNVLVNAAEIEDEEFVGEHLSRADDLLERAREIAARVEASLMESIGR
ncbi:MAG: glutamate formiminotransferase / formiminotetrahydrofolate cyclodeaminase [Pyrinomonadaceae bacterium]|nr:glutamate formiminotransferase / formiminotetrahydrofolate cyclodeaminase [Pyrinomonadaceae bacterium]